MSLVLAFDDEAPSAQSLAAALGWRCERIDRHRFPDGETRLRLPPQLPVQVALLRGLQQPNEKLAELLLAAAGARELGAEKLTLVSPYLAYMRQDIAFTPGEVVSQRHLGRLLAAYFDAVVTVDPHLHRVATMDEVVPGRRGVVLTAAPLLGAWIAQQMPGALLIGPDEEAEQWVRVAARAHGLDHAVCHKQRHGDRDVDVALPGLPVAGRAVVLFDDVASTGHTLENAVAALASTRPASFSVLVTHALFLEGTLERLRQAGVTHIWSTDSIPHPTNRLELAPLLAGALTL